MGLCITEVQLLRTPDKNAAEAPAVDVMTGVAWHFCEGGGLH